MTKAEEAALKAYPVEMVPLNYQDLIDQFGGKTEIDNNSFARRLFQEGYEGAEEELGWHPATEHPPVDEEVIVLHDITSNVAVGPLYAIDFGCVVDERYYENYNGWNIPGVAWWMPKPKLPKK